VGISGQPQRGAPDAKSGKMRSMSLATSGARSRPITPGVATGDAWALGALVLVGALVRFVTLGEQSLWFDEGLTRDLVVQPFGQMVESVADTENTPPLFYVITHLVTQVVGTGDVGLRLVSAVCGTATIAVAFLGGRELGGTRAGLGAAALVATNPMLVWFSQEARSYALLSLLTAVGLVCFLRTIRTGNRWALAGWAAASAAALVTHYFAIFPVAAEAGWLLWGVQRSKSRRPILLAAGAVAVAAAAIAPMAIAQEASGRAESIGQEDLFQRIAQIPKQFLVGYDGPLQIPLTLVSGALLLLAGAGLWRIRHRRQVLGVTLVVIVAVGVPIVAAIGGADFLYTRNVLPGLVPLLILAGAGFAASRPPPAGVAAAAALALLGLVTVFGVNGDPVYQRADWGSLDAAVGDSDQPRLLVVGGGRAEVPLGAYRDGIAAAPSAGAMVREIVFGAVAFKSSAGEAAAPPRPAATPAPAPGFALAGRELTPTYTLYRYRSPQPVRVQPAQLASRWSSSSSVLLLPPAAP